MPKSAHSNQDSTDPGHTYTPGVIGSPSSIRGVVQIPALQWITRSLLVLASLSLLAPEKLKTYFGVMALALVLLTPLARVCWLIFRFKQEKDRRMVSVGVGLLGIIAIGSLIAILR